MIPPRSDDFTIATSFDSPARLATIAGAIADLGDGRVTITRDDIGANLPPDIALDAVEAEALLVGLVLNGAADRAGRESPLVDASFDVDVEAACTILDEQAVALTALKTETKPERPTLEAEIVATVPDQLHVPLPSEVSDLDTRVRSTLLTAGEIVRIAMPYFDPQHPTVETLRTLPKRGIETRILTRGVDPETDRYRVLESMRASLTPAEQDLVDVAELFARDSDGKQAYATHAKMVIADTAECYLGSANFTVTNLTSNFEVGVITSGPEVSVAADTFDRVFDVSTSVPLPR